MFPTLDCEIFESKGSFISLYSQQLAYSKVVKKEPIIIFQMK